MCVCVLFHPVFSRVTVPTQLVFMAGPRCWRRLELLAWTSHKTGAGTMGQQWWVYTRCRPHITSNNEFINVEPVSFDIKKWFSTSHGSTNLGEHKVEYEDSPKWWFYRYWASIIELESHRSLSELSNLLLVRYSKPHVYFLSGLHCIKSLQWVTRLIDHLKLGGSYLEWMQGHFCPTLLANSGGSCLSPSILLLFSSRGHGSRWRDSGTHWESGWNSRSHAYSEVHPNTHSQAVSENSIH